MSGINVPRRPLNMQSNDVRKAAEDQRSASYESFRPNRIHPVQYKDMEDRPSTHAMADMRRNAAGVLDLDWAANKVIDAIHQAEYNGVLTPLQECLLTVVFPFKYQYKEPQTAELMTQLSQSEKEKIGLLVDAQLKAEDTWAAGQGRGATGGARRNNVGG